MKINKLRIKGFRSIGSNELEIDFSISKGYSVIVGPNGSGKSNIVEALRWVVLNKNITGYNIESSDFHNEVTTNALNIEVDLSETIPHGNTYNQFQDVALLRLAAQEYKVGEEKGSIRCNHQALTSEGKSILINQTTKLSKDRILSEEEKDGRQKPRPLMVRDIKDDIPFYFLDNASFDFHLSMRYGSLSWQLVRKIKEDIERDTNLVNHKGESITRSEAIDKVLEELEDLLKTESAKNTLEMLELYLSKQLQLPENSLGIQIGLPHGQELLKKVQIIASSSERSPKLPFNRLGRGYSSIAVLALFRAINNLDSDQDSAIVVLEEPELFLSPHLRSLFARELQKFSKQGNQVILVTHAAEFINPDKPESIIRVTKEDLETISHQGDSSDRFSFDTTLKFIEPNLNKLVLSKKIIFVEGDDDFAAVHAALSVININPEYFGLEILRLGGKGNLRKLTNFATNFDIQWAALLDSDAKSSLSEIDENGDLWKIFEPDLEGVLNTEKQSSNSEHVAKIVESCSSLKTLKEKYPKFINPLVDLLEQLGIDI